MALPRGILSPVIKPSPSEAAVQNLRLFGLVSRSDIGRKGLLTLLLSTATVPETSGSKNSLIQEYLKRSKDNKAKNDKERLDDYYKRNYKDYFEFIEGSMKEKEEGLLTDSEKGILEWLQKNRK